MNSHLTDEALDDVLIGLATAESEAHLAVCDLCRAKVRSFRSDVDTFNQASLAWSQSRAESLPAVHPLPTRAVKSPWAALAPVEWAMAAAVLLFIALPVWNHGRHPDLGAMVTPAAQNSEAQDSETQIAQDNDLLKSIDAALSASDVSPVAAYDLTERPYTHPKARPKLRNP
jgi:hypothetical protein